MIKKFSINKARRGFSGPWNPKNLTDFSGNVFRVAKFEGKYGKSLHVHKYDEFFLVLEGKIEIHTDREIIKLGTLEGVVVPAGIYHQPFSKKEALVLMLDPKE